MKNNIHQKTIILTGASGGIGSALTRLFITEYQCIVIGIGRSAEKLQILHDSLGECSDRFYSFPGDVTKRDLWQKLILFMKKHLLSPDILINNAGMLPQFSRFRENSAASAEHVMMLNFTAAVCACEAMLPLLMQASSPIIVNITSSAALAALPGTSAYSASKAALLRFTESLHTEYQKRIQVTAICPGFTKTDIFCHQEHDSNASVIDLISMHPDKMAKKIVRAIRRKKAKAVIGTDAKAMDIGYRFFGNTALRFFAWIMKKSNLPLFQDIFH